MTVEAQQDWTDRVEGLLRQAFELQWMGDHEGSLALVEEARALLQLPERQALRPDFQIEFLRLQVHAICRRGTGPDLAACRQMLADAFSLASSLGNSSAADGLLLGRLWRTQAVFSCYDDSHDHFETAVAAAGRAVTLLEALDLGRPDVRSELARSLCSKGLALRDLGAPGSLADELAAYDRAISIQETLDLERPEVRSELARSWTLKGSAPQELGDPANLAAAIAAYDKAIALQETLDLGRSDFRHSLAASWGNKGLTLRKSGDPANLEAAIAADDKAIALLETLDLGRPEFRSDLAVCWNNKGCWLQALGDPASLAAAIAAFDRAISLQDGLDLERPEFRRILAQSWGSKGAALLALGNPSSLADAIAALDRAIALLEVLDLERPGFRGDLALSCNNKGVTLLAKGGPDSLADAIADFDRAITLQETLDLERPEFRSGLARSWINKGLVQFRAAFGRGRQLTEALESLRRAQSLCERLLDFPRPFYLPAAMDTAPALLAMSRIQRKLYGPEAATDSLDDALLITRHLEQLGIVNQRGNREILFGEAMDCYRQAGQSGFLPELIREDLDPGKAGSACDSTAMHESALTNISKAITELPARAHQGETLGRLVQTLHWLEGIRTRHFAGSAKLALMNADQEHRAGRTAEAMRILDRQVAYRPLDPEGYWARARFRLLLGRRDDAVPDLIEAARHAIWTATDTARQAAAVAQLASELLRLRLADIADVVAGTLPPGNAAIQRRFDRLKDWLLMELPRSLLEARDEDVREAWRDVLPEIFNRHWDEAATLRDDLLQCQDREQARAMRQTLLADVQERIELCRGALALLPQRWRDFADEILASATIAATAFEADPPEIRGEKILGTVASALKRATGRLGDDELAAEAAELAALLGPSWTALLPQERQYLACALRCRHDPAMARFMPLELGCAVEFALLERMLMPVRAAHLSSGQELPPAIPARDDLRARFRAFLVDGAPLTLGQLVGGFRELTRLFGSEDRGELFGFLAARLAAQPGHPVPPDARDARWRRRVAVLAMLNERRRDAAHSRPAGQAEVQDNAALWSGTVEDPEDAFFRYFPAIFMPRAS